MACVQWGPALQPCMGVAQRRGYLAGLEEGTVRLQSLQGRGGWPLRTGPTVLGVSEQRLNVGKVTETVVQSPWQAKAPSSFPGRSVSQAP